jgi:hypothetical protein
MEQRPTDAFVKSVKEKSHAARMSLSHQGIPRDVRDVILDNTIYGNRYKPQIDEIIRVYNRVRDSVLEKYPDLNPSWLIQIIEKFIELLKTTPPNFPLTFLRLLKDIMLRSFYLTPSQVYAGNTEIPKYRVGVHNFIRHYRIDVNSDIGIKINRFFDEVITILSDVFDQMTDNHRHLLAMQHTPRTLYREVLMWTENSDADDVIRESVLNMFPIFISLSRLSNENRSLIQNLTFQDLLELEQQSGQQEGGFYKTRSNKRSNKKRSNKRRSNKKPTYKKRNNKKRTYKK